VQRRAPATASAHFPPGGCGGDRACHCVRSFPAGRPSGIGGPHGAESRTGPRLGLRASSQRPSGADAADRQGRAQRAGFAGRRSLTIGGIGAETCHRLHKAGPALRRPASITLAASCTVPDRTPRISPHAARSTRRPGPDVSGQDVRDAWRDEAGRPWWPPCVIGWWSAPAQAASWLPAPRLAATASIAWRSFSKARASIWRTRSRETP
jgi:hypothetical protein